MGKISLGAGPGFWVFGYFCVFVRGGETVAAGVPGGRPGAYYHPQGEDGVSPSLKYRMVVFFSSVSLNSIS